MISTLPRVLSTLAILAVVSPACAAEKRHQFLEPIRPDRPQQETGDTPSERDKVCYCQTIHQRNAAGRLTWKVICSKTKPEHSARKVIGEDCSQRLGLSPS